MFLQVSRVKELTRKEFVTDCTFFLVVSFFVIIQNRLRSKFTATLMTFMVLNLCMDHLMVGQIVASCKGLPTHFAWVLLVFRNFS